jgi:hypothetical protein
LQRLRGGDAMPTTVFVAGSMQIKHLDPKVKERIDNIVTSNLPELLRHPA